MLSAALQDYHRMPSGIGTSDTSQLSKSVTRLLQHSILQLCNEHIGYSHTLQVLGVLCVTIDDRQQELVVKVNNTLKRVNPVTPPKEAMPQPQSSVMYSQSQGEKWGQQEVPGFLNGSFGASSSSNTVGPQVDGQVSTPPRMESPGTTSRKMHGRKQSNPVKVKHVYDEGDMSDGDVITVEPSHPSTPEESPSQDIDVAIVEKPPSAKKLGGVKPVKRRLADVFGLSPSTSSPTVKALLAKSTKTSTETESPEKSNVETVLPESVCEENGRDDDSPKLVVILPEDCTQDEPGEEQSADPSVAGALNFSMCALNQQNDDEGDQRETLNTSQSSIGLGIKIKKESVRSYFPLGFDFAMNSTNNFDVSQDLAVQSAYMMGERCLPPALQLAMGPADISLGSLGNTTTINQYLNSLAGVASDVGLRNGIAPRPTYTISQSINDGLTMHLTKKSPGSARKLGNHSMKVKDIIMYDDSAPLHTQKGNKIEGDFMLDSLNMTTSSSSKKRRRRTAEDTLTAEEIAEYVGSCDRILTSSCTYICKYCNELSPDLSRYFNHTLSAHNSYICHQCGKNFTTKSSLLRHRPIHTGMRRFACSICKKSFYRKDKCKAHIKRHLGITVSDQSAAVSDSFQGQLKLELHAA